MDWAAKIYANTLFVLDLTVSKEFYGRVFEKSPVYEDAHSIVFKFGDLLINLLVQDEAATLIAPAKLASQNDGSRYQLTIQVDDVDTTVKRLLRLGVRMVNGPIDRPWGIRTALFADPDGHLWELAQ